MRGRKRHRKKAEKNALQAEIDASPALKEACRALPGLFEYLWKKGVKLLLPVE